MIRTHMSYVIACSDDFEALKKSAAIFLTGIPQHTIRLEYLARVLGFRTLAALQTYLCSGSSARLHVNLCGAADFAVSKKINVDPLTVYLTLAAATVRRVARLSPGLHVWRRNVSAFRP